MKAFKTYQKSEEGSNRETFIMSYLVLSNCQLQDKSHQITNSCVMASVLLQCLHRPQALLIGSAPGCADLANPRLPHTVCAALADLGRSWQIVVAENG